MGQAIPDRVVRAGLVLLAVLSSGCVSDVTVEQPTVWEAEIVAGLEHPGAEGSAAAISTAQTTEVGITVSGLEASSYLWRVREGSCDSPGSVLGSDAQYPDLSVEDDGGTANMETQVSRSPMRSGRSYHAEVRRENPADQVACGDFEQRR